MEKPDARSASPTWGLAELAPRDQLLRLVAEEPGITSRAAAIRLQLPLTLLHYYAGRLASDRQILRLRIGRHVRLFLHDWRHEVFADDVAIVQEETAKKIILAICETPGLHIKDLIERTGCSQRAVYFHVKRLRDAALVHSPSSHQRGLHPDPRLFALLMRPGEDEG